MRILLYGINYSPELTGIGKYTGEMAEWLAAKGHEVHVITAMPYYPEWSVHAAYKGKAWHTEQINGVHVHRTPLYVPKDVGAAKRIVHEFSFLLSSGVHWFKLFFTNRFDVVFSIAPPFHLAIAPWVYRWLKKTIWINHIQDLQVDAAKDLGMIKNKALLNIMFKMEAFFLNRATRVATISEGMQKKILAKKIEAQRLLFFPNWVDSKVVYPLSRKRSMRQELGFTDADKIVLYSGNLGEKQGLDAIIQVASQLRSNNQIKFVICGSGGAKQKLMDMSKELALDNVFFFGLQPYEKLASLLAMADLHLVLQKASAADLVMPSKLTGILAAGGCALITAEPGTTLYDVVNQYKMGFLVPPESVERLTETIHVALSQDNALIKENARRYSEQYLEKDKILTAFEEDLKHLVNLKN